MKQHLQSTLLPLFFLPSFFVVAQQSQSFLDGEIIQIEAKPDGGFNYDYFLFLPNNVSANIIPLLVETNNTGSPSDDIFIHEHNAKGAAIRYSSGNYVASRLKIPFLVPVFPRPQSSALTYTHALDRETMLLNDGKSKRLDLQLLAMIEDARKFLGKREIILKEKVFLNGFSASGTFLNRFTFMHPEIVEAISAGGLNAMLMLPLDSISDEALNYPLGIRDFPVIVGKTFDYEAFKSVPQFLYMGMKDRNDAVKFDDAYNEEERRIVYATLGETMLPERWNKCQEIYKNGGLNVSFRSYDHIGHGTDFKVLNDIVAFFELHLK